MRKGVRISALRTARGVPVGDRRVMEPLGHVAAPLGLGVSMIGTVNLEDAVDDLDREGDDEDKVGDLGRVGDEERDPDLDIAFTMEEWLEPVDVRVGGAPTSSLESSLALGAASVTIFTPIPLSLFAGMKRVVRPSLLLTEMRKGWPEAQHSLSSGSVAVE